ncbi:MAG: hypothetical protein ACRCX8_08735 [Sarcina sp.]
MGKVINFPSKELTKEEIYQLFGIKKEEIKFFETEEYDALWEDFINNFKRK